MAYWIHENGETIGPLRAMDVVERATPDTLVSHGQEWVPLREHPDFPAQDRVQPVGGSAKVTAGGVSGSSVNDLRATAKSDDSNTTGKAQYWVLPPGSQTPLGPFPHREVTRRGNKNLRVSCGDIWVPFGEHPDFGFPAEGGDEKSSRHISLIKLVFASLAFLFLVVVLIGVVGSTTQRREVSTSQQDSQVQSNNFGPGPCGENFERAIQAAEILKNYDESIFGQRLDPNTSPGKELGLINSLIVNPSVGDLTPDEIRTCSLLALKVGVTLGDPGGGAYYLQQGLQLGNPTCALILGHYSLQRGNWSLGYLYAYLGQAADPALAKEQMAIAASHIPPHEVDQIIQKIRSKGF